MNEMANSTWAEMCEIIVAPYVPEYQGIETNENTIECVLQEWSLDEEIAFFSCIL